MSLKPLPIDFAQSASGRSDFVRSVPSDAADAVLPNIAAVDLHSLDTESLDFWMRAHEQIECLDSPYYHPEFSRAVAAVRNDVKIGVLRNRQGTVTSLLPYQQLISGTADPIGGRMNDFHGIIQSENAAVDLSAVLSRLQLKRFSYHALSAGTRLFDPFTFERLPSYAIDLTGGWLNYQSWARGNSRTIARLPQKFRALQRDHGNLRFEFASTDPTALERLIELKQAKYRRTKTFDILSVEWAANLLRQIHWRDTAGFKGLLSVVWAGDRLVAAHFGMISGSVLHYWFPVYDPEFARYSPGIHLLMETCRVAAERGIQRIDLSYGESEFKNKFSNAISHVGCGLVDFNPLTWTLFKQRYLIRNRLRRIPLKQNLKTVLRGIFPGYGRWHFR